MNFIGMVRSELETRREIVYCCLSASLIFCKVIGTVLTVLCGLGSEFDHLCPVSVQFLTTI